MIILATNPDALTAKIIQSWMFDLTKRLSLVQEEGVSAQVSKAALPETGGWLPERVKSHTFLNYVKASGKLVSHQQSLRLLEE